WGARRAHWAQPLMRHHEVVQADDEPDLPPMARVTRGQIPDTAPQGREEPRQGAIPTFHEGRLDRRAKLAQAQLLAKTARTTEDDTRADLHDMPHLVADLDHLGIKQGLRSHQPGRGLAARLAVLDAGLRRHDVTPAKAGVQSTACPMPW